MSDARLMPEPENREKEHGPAPSPWLLDHLDCLPVASPVLDLACGSGRHVRLLASRGYPVIGVDRDAAALAGLAELAGVSTRCLDLEGADWPLAGERYAGIVVTNYLWRPRFADLLALLAPGGVLIYETFMIGNAEFGKPSNPDFLLAAGELRERCQAAGLAVLDFTEGRVDFPKPAMRQAIVARRPAD